MAIGYISEGEMTIDIQSQQAATLHMITIRVILPQFAMIGLNRLRVGTRILHSSFMRDWSWKASRRIEPVTLSSTSEICGCTCIQRLFWSRSSGFGALVQWLSGRVVQRPSGCRLFVAGGDPTTILCLELIQIAAPHGLGYNTSLACPQPIADLTVALCSTRLIRLAWLI